MKIKPSKRMKPITPKTIPMIIGLLSCFFTRMFWHPPLRAFHFIPSTHKHALSGSSGFDPSELGTVLSNSKQSTRHYNKVWFQEDSLRHWQMFSSFALNNGLIRTPFFISKVYSFSYWIFLYRQGTPLRGLMNVNNICFLLCQNFFKFLWSKLKMKTYCFVGRKKTVTHLFG